MRTRLYRHGVLERADFPLGEISDHVQETDVTIWIDLVQPDGATLAQLGEELGLHRLALEDAAHERQRPKVDVYAEHLFLTVYDVDGITEDEPTGGAFHFDVRELAVFVTRNVLITVRKDPGINLDEVLARWDESADLAKYGVAFLLWGLLDVLVDRHFAAVEALDARLDQLEDQLFEPAAHDITQRRSFALRKALLRLRRVILPMREVVSVLMRHDLPAPTEAMTPYWFDVYDHTQRAAEWTESIREMVATVTETTVALQGNRLNLITKKVTGWAAIIAVPTAVTSFYGENVPYPGFGHPAGFWTSVGLIVVVSLVLYVLFRRRDWL